ncbi:MAG: isoprenylcysteine carboxylmethyltransferase family protein [Candidatus Omnitrophica bacterium]|nr:isoprenylcysteine carboxylmethyltransferase family protein [Candidatus Omnitrophota bacterium]
MKKIKEMLKLIAGRGGIIVFFVMAFEVMIMISPFAFFFYSVFNPIFKWLDQYMATSWLTSFFLPHMIMPPTLFLKTIRVLGSVFFILGSFTFIICALQVYLGKIFKWGVADKGLYKYIRHPQYLALGIWGIGMSILWPRFIVLVSLSVMFILYIFLAKDEERRMLKSYKETYKNYMSKTGMFFPKAMEKNLSFIKQIIPESPIKYPVISALIVILVVGAGFALREITLHSLYFETKNNISLLSMLPEDSRLEAVAIDGIIKAQRLGKLDMLDASKNYLGYLMPGDYVMQGMIANTGGQFHLFKQHHTVMMITEWVMHPFGHLRSSPTLHMAKMHGVDPAMARRHHCPLGINDPSMDCKTCPYRRVIIDEVSAKPGTLLSGKELLSFDTTRVPVVFIDINTKTGEIVNAKKVEKATAWADVPTPAI